MTVQDDLRAGLTGHAGTVALIAQRVYPRRFPQGVTFPCVTYARISTTFEQAIDRTVHGRASRFQLTCWDDDYDGAQALGDQVEAALAALAGSSVTLYTLTLEGRDDDEDPETGLHRVMIDVMVVWS